MGVGRCSLAFGGDLGKDSEMGKLKVRRWREKG